VTTGGKSGEGRKADKAEERRARLGRALRANLLRRKAQASARLKTAAPEDKNVRER
jgi:hypothetical protein